MPRSLGSDDETDELLLDELLDSSETVVRRRRHAAFVVAAVAVLAAVVAAGLVVVRDFGSTAGPAGPAADGEYSTLPVVAKPTWRCPSGTAPTSGYQVAVTNGQPSRLEAIGESCLESLTASGALATQFMIGLNTLTVVVNRPGAYQPDAPRSAWQKVNVNGTTGYYRREGAGTAENPSVSTLYWEYAHNADVVVSSKPVHDWPGLSLSALVAVAESSLWRGQIATLPMRLSKIPAGYTVMDVLSSPDSGQPRADIELFDHTVHHEIDVSLSPDPYSTFEHDVVQRTTVNGRAAAFTTGPLALVIQLGTGSTLQLSTLGTGGVTEKQLMHIAEDITVVPDVADTANWYSIGAAIPAE